MKALIDVNIFMDILQAREGVQGKEIADVGKEHFGLLIAEESNE